VAGQSLLDALKQKATADDLITVVCPVNEPQAGYVVYEDTRRAAAGRRLDKTLKALREAGIPAHGMVVDNGPVDATRDALAQLEPPVDEIVLSTHPEEVSGWLSRNVPEQIRKLAGSIPVDHVVADASVELEKNVLVVANETVLGRPLLDKIRDRAKQSPATFLIVAPQSDPTARHHPEADRRLRRALAQLRAEGIDAHGQVAHPDPYTAAMHAVHDERIDEIIISTFPGEARSSWLRKDVVTRLRDATGLPVEHVEVEPHAEPVTV
jgi:hypothetical protein